MSEQQTPRNVDLGPERPRRLPSQSGDMAKAQARIVQLDDGCPRAAAELDNFRKRCAKDLVRAREQEGARTAAGWLPVVDNLERALDHASSDPEQIIAGVRAVHQQALSVLAGLGFPRRDDTGRAFDPALHDAVGTMADEELPPARWRGGKPRLWPGCRDPAPCGRGGGHQERLIARDVMRFFGVRGLLTGPSLGCPGRGRA